MNQNLAFQQRMASQLQFNDMMDPKNNVKGIYNPNPALGGRFYNSPELTPNLPFTKAVKMTPNSNHFVKIIPWDHLNKDFVYSTVEDKIFKGKMSVRQLKRVSLFNKLRSWMVF